MIECTHRRPRRFRHGEQSVRQYLHRRQGSAELQALLRKLNADPRVYAAVLTGQGEKFFSAGADLKNFADGDKVRSAAHGAALRRGIRGAARGARR